MRKYECVIQLRELGYKFDSVGNYGTIHYAHISPIEADTGLPRIDVSQCPNASVLYERLLERARKVVNNEQD